jgi:hypothetical protein
MVTTGTGSGTGRASDHPIRHMIPVLEGLVALCATDAAETTIKRPN